MSPARTRRNVNAAAVAILGLNFLLWMASSDIYARWEGVPPVPTHDGALMMTLGDAQFSYRFGAITLQNLGDNGGQTTPLKDYNYEKLGKWFWLLNELDPASNHVPMLAAYYFGATRTPQDVKILVDYLGKIGQNPYGNKWRWLVQAIFMARHRMNDLHTSLDLAYKLSKMQPIGDTLPEWARQMPAFVLQQQGDRQAARKIVEDLLTSSQHFHPNEVNFMKAYLVEQLGVDPKEVEQVIKMRGNEDQEQTAPALPHPAPEPE
jgi:hypothetical protein